MFYVNYKALILLGMCFFDRRGVSAQYLENDSFCGIEVDGYDILGRRVAVLINGELKAGTHQTVFDATHMATGIYIYWISVNGRPSTTITCYS